MDKFVETLNKIRSLFNMDEIKLENDPTPQKEEVVIKMGTETLADGTIISWEGEVLAVGVVVSKDVEGTLTPLEDGEYPLQSGMILVISGGVLTEIKEPAEVEEAEAVEEVKAEASVELETLKADIETLKADIEDLKVQIADFTKTEKTLNSKIEKLSKSPDGEPLQNKVEKTSPLTEIDKKLNALDKMRLSR